MCAQKASRNKNRHVARAMGKGHGGSANSCTLAASMLRNQCTTFAARGVARNTSKTAGLGSNADQAFLAETCQETRTATSLTTWDKRIGNSDIPTHWLLACLGTHAACAAALRPSTPSDTARFRGCVQTLTGLWREKFQELSHRCAIGKGMERVTSPTHDC